MPYTRSKRVTHRSLSDRRRRRRRSLGKMGKRKGLTPTTATATTTATNKAPPSAANSSHSSMEPCRESSTPGCCVPRGRRFWSCVPDLLMRGRWRKCWTFTVPTTEATTQWAKPSSSSRDDSLPPSVRFEMACDPSWPIPYRRPCRLPSIHRRALSACRSKRATRLPRRLLRPFTSSGWTTLDRKEGSEMSMPLSNTCWRVKATTSASMTMSRKPKGSSALLSTSCATTTS